MRIPSLPNMGVDTDADEHRRYQGERLEVAEAAHLALGDPEQAEGPGEG
jgi:hypothetical protein